MSRTDDEPRFNATLVEKLKRDLGVDLSALVANLPTDDQGVDVPRLLDAVRNAVRELRGVEVIEETPAPGLTKKTREQLLDAAVRANVTRFLHVSTDEVYGSLGETGLFTEETPYDPRSPYSASKAGSDHLVSAWGHTYGLPVVITNCSNNYGPYHFPEKLIPLMIIKGLAGELMPVYGAGKNVRDWLFVDDHAEALTLVRRGIVSESDWDD